MLRIIKKVFFFLLISHLAYIVLIRFVDPPITVTKITSIIEGNGFKRTHLSLDEMYTAAKLAVIASEDQLFPDHNGFDIKGIERAMAFNKKKKRKKDQRCLYHQPAGS